ncbi:MAG: aminodeoxychorismate lyase, partial [Prevotella sp.]|nr:aminodeoxychorismate lyase [Prevotella sp.]
MKHQTCKKYITAIAICLVVILGVVYYYFFSSFSAKSETSYLYIDKDDSIDSVYDKLRPIANAHSFFAFRTLARHFDYAQHIRTGRYAIRKGEGALTLFRHLRNGQQTPVDLSIPSAVRTIGDLSYDVSKKLMLDEEQLYDSLTNEQV